MNNDQEIILAKISAVYDKPPFVKMETGQMEMILKCVGLGAYYDKYREYLEPYWYNGRFQNPVESYIKGNWISNTATHRGAIQASCYSIILKTNCTTMVFKKFCITTRTKELQALA